MPDENKMTDKQIEEKMQLYIDSLVLHILHPYDHFCFKEGYYDEMSEAHDLCLEHMTREELDTKVEVIVKAKKKEYREKYPSKCRKMLNWLREYTSGTHTNF